MGGNGGEGMGGGRNASRLLTFGSKSKDWGGGKTRDVIYEKFCRHKERQVLRKCKKGVM